MVRAYPAVKLRSHYSDHGGSEIIVLFEKMIYLNSNNTYIGSEVRSSDNSPKCASIFSAFYFWKQLLHLTLLVDFWTRAVNHRIQTGSIISNWQKKAFNLFMLFWLSLCSSRLIEIKFTWFRTFIISDFFSYFQQNVISWRPSSRA